MIRYKTEEEIGKLREGGRINARILRELARKVRLGVKTIELNRYAEKLLDEAEATASFLGYRPHGVNIPYPASLCVSINEEVVHGIPSEKRILKEGDIVTLDLGVTYKNMITDHAITVPVGKVDQESLTLLRATKEALESGIKALKIGGYVGDFGAEVLKIVKKYRFSIAKDLSGHGVGYSVHEEPFVPNEAIRGEGPELRVGMVIALEPMFCIGKGEVKCLPDKYTYVTRDGRRAAQFEHTVAITKKGVEILTEL
jgi:methionyl aminopeptidase